MGGEPDPRDPPPGRLTVEAPEPLPDLWSFAALPIPGVTTVLRDALHPSALVFSEAAGAARPVGAPGLPECGKLIHQPCRAGWRRCPGSLGFVSSRRARWLLLVAIAVLVGTTAAASRGTTVPEQAPSGLEAPAMVVDAADQVAVAAKKQSRLVGLTLLVALALVVMHVGSHPRRAPRSAWARVAALAVVRTAPSRGPPRLLLAPS